MVPYGTLQGRRRFEGVRPPGNPNHQPRGAVRIGAKSAALRTAHACPRRCRLEDSTRAVPCPAYARYGTVGVSTGPRWRTGERAPRREPARATATVQVPAWLGADERRRMPIVDMPAAATMNVRGDGRPGSSWCTSTRATMNGSTVPWCDRCWCRNERLPGWPGRSKAWHWCSTRCTEAGMGGKTSLKVERFAARTCRFAACACRVRPFRNVPKKIRLMEPFRTPEAGGGPLPAQRCRRPYMQPILTIRDARARRRSFNGCARCSLGAGMGTPISAASKLGGAVLAPMPARITWRMALIQPLPARGATLRPSPSTPRRDHDETD